MKHEPGDLFSFESGLIGKMKFIIIYNLNSVYRDGTLSYNVISQDFGDISIVSERSLVHYYQKINQGK